MEYLFDLSIEFRDCFFSFYRRKERKKKTNKTPERGIRSGQKTHKNSYPPHLVHYPASSKACLGVESQKKDKHKEILSLVYPG